MGLIPRPHVVIYTDGACDNLRNGGWGAHMICGWDKLYLSGSEKDTTNNRMELQAVISSLSQLTTSCTVDLYTDSSYVCDGINFRLKQWTKRGWRTSEGSPIKNKDLWVKLNKLRNKHRVKAIWVKGHSGDEGNELVDELAVLARKR